MNIWHEPEDRPLCIFLSQRQYDDAKAAGYTRFDAEGTEVLHCPFLPAAKIVITRPIPIHG